MSAARGVDDWSRTPDRAAQNETFGPRRVVVSDALVRRHAFVHDAAVSAVSLPTGEVSPLVVGNDLLRIYEERHQRHADVGGLHLRESLQLLSPVWTGEVLELSGRYAGWFPRGDVACLVVDAEAHGEDGRLIARARATESLPAAPDGVPERPPLPSLPRRVSPSAGPVGEAAHPWRTPMPGARLPELRRRLEQEHLSVYSGGASFERNLHTDPDKAAERGYARPVAQGMHLCGLVDELCRQHLGVRWWLGGELDVRFVGPVLAGSPLVVGGAVVATDERGGSRVEIDVWVTCGEDAVLVGVASAPR
ncbi:MULTISPECIES: MaoC family dehydratase [unclassified Nocardioides]|uniref:MaoC family dehydratase n=1 Tax=unclassified Nocardioides TaxID=2615069 RepID=UPI000056FE58|nr:MULTISPECIES: MaoC family dehydratase [unclassified Nocardioides]ABL79595.1 MaoC domain protein dehydratase [Nocardioides sp. JS614]